jgi:hypothetical protein
VGRIRRVSAANLVGMVMLTIASTSKTGSSRCTDSASPTTWHRLPTWWGWGLGSVHGLACGTGYAPVRGGS